MSLAMPYRVRGQSRVEFIKKKFESSFSQENDPGPVKRTNTSIPSKSSILEELKDVKVDKKPVSAKTETCFDANKQTEGKALVKRSPAFRREKLNFTKSLTQISSQKAVDKSERLNETAQIPKTNVNTCEEIKRSKTDTNLLQYCTSRTGDKGTVHITKNSDVSKPLVSQNRDSECEVNEKISAQYSVVNKKRNNADKNEAVNLKLSESIRRALQSPLPKGPPPKKPPRTFCHVLNSTQTNSSTNSSRQQSQNSSVKNLSTATKLDIPKLKSKLDKLEKVIKSHQASLEKKAENKKETNKTPSKVESCSMPNMADYQSCLPLANCLNQSLKIQNFKKVPKAKSEFYLERNKENSKLSEPGKSNEFSYGPKTDDVSVRIASPEAIYDLPCVNKKNSFETFGKFSKDLKESVNAKKAEGLHYMCTDVINQAFSYPNFQSNDLRKNPETASQPFEPKTNFLASGEKPKTATMNKTDDTLSNQDEKKRIKELSVSATPEESSGESDAEFNPANSDCNEIKNKIGPEIKDTLFQMANRRKIYLSRVSSRLMSQVPHWKYKCDSYSHLFECCLLVGLTLCESKKNLPYIKSIFPPDTKPPPLIESLCFPDASYWPPTSEHQHPEEQNYSLVVTNENGERKFGYCRRVLPEGCHVCLPLTYCIISTHRAGGFFYKVLEELESRHGSPGLDNFIKQLYESKFPGPGERLKLKEILEEATGTSRLDSDVYLSSTLVRRPSDVRLEEKNLTQLFQHLHLPVVLKVFSSLLHERKVLLLSNSLRNLSSCIEALQSILIPFSWQHTYIPVLPVHLIELCEAPTPYVIGLLKPRNVEKSLSNVSFEDGILVDLDDSKIIKCCGDEGSILPTRFVRDLKTSLNLAMNASDDLSESVRGVLISDAFIRFFVQVCGNYTKFLQTLPNGDRNFQKDEFIKSASSNAVQSFLDWFSETAMFNSFIQERLQGDDEDMLVKLFRRRALEYLEGNVKDSTIFLKTYNKKVRSLGDKIKDFTSFTK